MPQSVTGQANAVATQMLGPNISAIVSARGQYDAQSAKEQANARAFSLALAHMMRSIGPEVHSSYAQAGNATASFAKGFSDAEKHQAANESATLGDFLDKAGVPADARAQALSHAGGTSDVLYGTKGYSPASSLVREGAAFGSAADQLPQVAIAEGNSTVSQLAQAQMQGDQKYAQMVAGEQGKIPAEAASLLSSMGLTPTGQPKAGYYVDKGGNVLPDGYIWRNGHPVRQHTGSGSGSGSGKSLEQTLAPDQPKLNSYVSSNFTVLPSGTAYDNANGKKVTYAEAAKSLFAQYRYLIKELPKSQQSKGKKVLNGMIGEALTGAGFKAPQPASDNPLATWVAGW